MRVEIIPVNWKESAEYKRGDGSPTIDVCRKCVKDFTEGQPLPVGLIGLTGSIDVAHPPYDDVLIGDTPFECFFCATLLTEQDD